jgi:hypothetical protein
MTHYKTSAEITAEQAEDAIKRAGLFVASVIKYIESVN